MCVCLSVCEDIIDTHILIYTYVITYIQHTHTARLTDQFHAVFDSGQAHYELCSLLHRTGGLRDYERLRDTSHQSVAQVLPTPSLHTQHKTVYVHT